MKADGIDEVLRADSQLELPQRPRFSEDYLVLPVAESGLLVLGGEKPEFFRGKSARILLPRLLPLLDGTRTIPELLALVPQLSGSMLRDVLSLLYLRGLLEEGERESDRRALSAEERFLYDRQLAFFGRYTDVTRTRRNRYETQLSLKNTRALLLASSEIWQPIAAELARSGLGALSIRLKGSITPPPERPPENPLCEWRLLSADSDLATTVRDHTFVIAIAGRDDVEEWTELDGICRRESVPWLRVMVDSQNAEVGPLFTERECGCYRCFFQSLDAAESLRPEVWSPTTRRTACGFATLSILMVLTRLFLANLTNRRRRLRLIDGDVLESQYARLPRCSVCGSGADSQAAVALPEDLALLFHLETNLRWTETFPKGHQLHYSEAVSEITAGAYKLYRTRPKVPLPLLEELEPFTTDLADVIAGWHAPSPLRIGATHLARLCGWSARWRKPGTLPMRFAPSGGSLCSVDLYPIVWNVDEVEPGIYHYDGSTHRLEQLRKAEPRDLLASVVHPQTEIDSADMAIVTAAQMVRLRSKYGPRAYRYAHLDAGVMCQSLYLLSRANGIRMWTCGRFLDDELAALIEVPGLQEYPVQIAFFGLRAETAR